jgi:glycosyltransferase involved in cell wall biosynthesis
MTDLVRHLGDRGTEAVVLCGDSAIPTEASPAPRARIIRIPNLIKGTGLVPRLVSFCAYLAATVLYVMFGPKPDVIVTLTTPPLLSVIGLMAKKLRGCRYFIWEMDLYPEVAIDTKVLKPDALVTRLLAHVANTARRCADGVIVIGECMRDRLISSGVPSERLFLAENWADGSLLTSACFPSNVPITVLYSGNLGRVHDTRTIARVMEKMKHESGVRFVFVGGGSGRLELEAFCKNAQIPNVEFQQYRRSDKLQTLLGESHIGLVTLRAECLGASIPSKMYEYMAVGRPLLFIGPRQSSVASLIGRHQCGWSFSPGDVEEVTNLLRQLLADRTILPAAGVNARNTFLAKYDMPQRVSHVAEYLSRGTSLSELPARKIENITSEISGVRRI